MKVTRQLCEEAIEYFVEGININRFNKLNRVKQQLALTKLQQFGKREQELRPLSNTALSAFHNKFTEPGAKSADITALGGAYGDAQAKHILAARYNDILGRSDQAHFNPETGNVSDLVGSLANMRPESSVNTDAMRYKRFGSPPRKQGPKADPNYSI